IDDLVYVYLDLLRSFGAQRTHLVGMGIGGWIAAEIAIRCTHHLRKLVLVDAVGIKVSGVTERDIADNFVVGANDLMELLWHDPAVGREVMKVPGLTTMDEPTLTAVLRNRQT